MTVEEIRNKILPILQTNGAARVGLFGSAARGAANPDSDIDILVDIPKRMTLLDLIGIKQQLEKVLGKKVDLVEYQALKPALREKIL
ncbi:MAG: nucleotidyltransferase family protein [Patescibacteria group bacterium]